MCRASELSPKLFKVPMDTCLTLCTGAEYNGHDITAAFKSTLTPDESRPDVVYSFDDLSTLAIWFHSNQGYVTRCRDYSVSEWFMNHGAHLNTPPLQLMGA